MRSEVLAGFLIAADRHPQRPALVYHGQAQTYAQLAARVRRVAARLGRRPGVVGVTATHSPATITGLLAVWAAGGTYCPVDPAFPAARRRAMLAAVGCTTLLDADLAPHALAGTDDAETADDAEADVAYTLFTSGSTGAPKPVLTPHAAIGASVASLRDLFGLTPADRVLQFASLNWDTCFEEILPALTSGACLVLHNDAHSGSFARLLRLIEREQITMLDLPTAFWHELVTYLVEARAALPSGVRLVVIGGEAASPARLADWRALPTGHARLVNTYGCTETTLITHAVDLHGPCAPGPALGSGAPGPALASGAPGPALVSGAPVPIGRALPHVVEEISAEGELLIGGPALALGYRGLREATEARFITADGRRLFRTGDRVSRLPGGGLVHQGRIDHEIKIRGVRVNPAEVEAHIAAHPGVSAVAVTGVGVADHTILAAYVVARPLVDPAGLDASIIDYLRDRVPTHLIPGRVRVVPDLVYTAGGKVDRHRIKEAFR